MEIHIATHGLKNTVGINVPNKVPPIIPSIVLLGDTSTSNLCLPIKYPVKYAYTSVDTLIKSKYISKLKALSLISIKAEKLLPKNKIIPIKKKASTILYFSLS